MGAERDGSPCRGTSERRRDVFLALLDGAVGLSAIGGAIYAVGGAKDWPREWLEGSPFKTYLVPGLVLGLVHAPINLVAARALLGKHPGATQAALVAGVVQVGWILVQARIIGMRSFLQPLLGAIGGTSLGLAVARTGGSSDDGQGAVGAPNVEDAVNPAS